MKVEPVHATIVSPTGDTLKFYIDTRDEFMGVLFYNAHGRDLFVGAPMDVCDYTFKYNTISSVHKDFARAVWNALVERFGWRRIL